MQSILVEKVREIFIRRNEKNTDCTGVENTERVDLTKRNVLYFSSFLCVLCLFNYYKVFLMNWRSR